MRGRDRESVCMEKGERVCGGESVWGRERESVWGRERECVCVC